MQNYVMPNYFYWWGIAVHVFTAAFMLFCFMSIRKKEKHAGRITPCKDFTDSYNELWNQLKLAKGYYLLRSCRSRLDALQQDFGGYEQPAYYKKKINRLYKLYYERLRIITDKNISTAVK